MWFLHSTLDSDCGNMSLSGRKYQFKSAAGFGCTQDSVSAKATTPDVNQLLLWVAPIAEVRLVVPAQILRF